MVEQAIAAFLAQYVTGGEAAAQKSGPLVIAVSGGADSLALLHGLARQMPAQQLVVAHLNHRLRGADADADADFVAQEAGALGCRFSGGREDVAALAQAAGYTLEEAARRARYAFLAAVARQYGAQWVMTGHTADDQAETVLMHLLRGSGLAGLGGMRPVGPLPYLQQRGPRLGRPLLTVWRSDIEAYCRAHALAPRSDASNSDTAFTRNRIRRHLLPLLAAETPRVRQRLTNLADLAAADEAFLVLAGRQALTETLIAQDQGWLRLDGAAWRALPLALRRRVLWLAIEQLGGPSPVAEINMRVLEHARAVAERAAVGQQATLPDGATLAVGYDDLVLTASGVTPPVSAPQIGGAVELPVPGTVNLGADWTLTAAWRNDVGHAAIISNPDPWQAFLALPESAQLTVRGRRPGERMRPLGLNGSGTLKELMIDRKVPAAQRAKWPLLVADGRVVWLVGHVVGAEAAVTPECVRVLHVVCRPAAGDINRSESLPPEAG